MNIKSESIIIVETEDIKHLGLTIKDILNDLETAVVKFDNREENSAVLLAYETARVWSHLNVLTSVIIDKSKVIEKELEAGDSHDD